MKASYPDNGDVLGGAYRLETVLSEGRSSRVYRAVQEAMQRQVAIKVLAPEVCRDLVARMRFEQEARICVELRHPNLVELVDIGLTNGGLPFYAMELLSGRALSELRPGDLSETRIGEVARELLNGLAAVHDAGIVHRNIKPSNIILCDYVGGEEAVKLIGFGGAKVVEPLEDSELATFETGALGGERVSEPRYMSPEQLRGKVPGPASDLYAIGLVLAELLSGEPVVRGQNVTDVAEQVLSGQPLALPDHVRLSAFGALITQCLNIDVEERPQTCDEAMCLLVESGLGGDETVQFSSAEALMRYEASRRSEPEQPARVARTPAGTVETTLPAEIFDTPSEQPGRALPAGPGRSATDMKSSVPGMTERTDTRKAESEALGRLDPVRHPTEAVFATEPEPRKPAKGRAGLFYGVAAVAILVALFILAIGIAALFWLTSNSAESSTISSEPVAWSTIDETR